MDAFAASLARSPELFPLALDPVTDSVTVIRLRRADYLAASFLDQRLLSSQTVKRTEHWQAIRSAVAAGGLIENCHYIFHVGHVGSTLLSRLLANDRRVLPLREPAILRTLAQAGHGGLPAWNRQELEERVSTCLKLWSRRFDAGEQVCLKATSFVAEMASDLLARPSAPKAILLHAAPAAYLATILGAPNSPMEARALAPDRQKRLEQRLRTPLPPLSTLSEGELVAMGWACEMTALMQAKDVAGDRAIYLDFDAFLLQPAEGLARAFAQFDIPVCETDVEAILQGPDMRRYSKAPEHAYDANLRREVLAAARAHCGAEIRAGLAWLERMASAFPPIERALNALPSAI